MNLLAIDTSTEQASIAVLVDSVITCEEQGSQRTHAQILLPMLDNLLTKAEISLNQLDGIIFGCGPGSFTGLRIACSIAKGLAYAHDLDLIPVSSLTAIAWAARKQQQQANTPVLAVLDARMNELYWAFFDNDYQSIEQVTKACAIQIPDTSSLILAGSGIDLYWEHLPDSLKTKVSDTVALAPNAAAMIELVCELEIQPVPIAQAQPIYVRNQVTQGDSRG